MVDRTFTTLTFGHMFKRSSFYERDRLVIYALAVRHASIKAVSTDSGYCGKAMQSSWRQRRAEAIERNLFFRH